MKLFFSGEIRDILLLPQLHQTLHWLQRILKFIIYYRSRGAILATVLVYIFVFLHSDFSFNSPVSAVSTQGVEVSCFGDDESSDTGDYWKLEIEGGGKSWRQDQKVRILHVDTNGYLHSHNKKYSRIAGGQQEVCGVAEKRPDNIWLASEGVYLPVTGSK